MISRWHVLTAAHCLRDYENPRMYQVRAGSSLTMLGGSQHRVANYTVHEEFDYDRGLNDIAVLRLEKPIQVGTPARMFESGEEIKAGDLATAVGWGLVSQNGVVAERLQSVELTVVDRKNCSMFYADEESAFPDGVICAADVYGGSICTGDSGGPLVVDEKLAGVVAWSDACDTYKYPNVFSEVAHHRKWIDRSIEGWFITL